MQEENNHNVLCEIKEILQELKKAQKVRSNIDQTVLISSTVCYTVDFKDRYHIYAWSANGLTFTLEDLGTYTISAGSWNDITFTSGMRIYAQGQNNPVPLLIRCSDIVMPGAIASGSVLGSVTANAGTNLNTSALALESGGHLQTIDTSTSASKTDLDTIVTNTNKIPASPAQEAGNLATIATNTTGLATQTTLSAAKTDLDSIVTNTTSLATQATLSAAKTDLDNISTVEGATTDAAVTGDSNGTFSAKLRGLSKILADVWNSTTHFLAVQDVVNSSGGETPYHNITAATTNFTNAKASACQMYEYTLSNTSASVMYVKFYDKASTPSTSDVPARTVQVNANTTIEKTIPKGLKFVNGFGWAATGGVANNDNTATSANNVVDFALNA